MLLPAKTRRAEAQRQLHSSAVSAAPVGSLLWALFSLQLFFCTGHFCEFAGLQYTAGVHPVSNASVTGCDYAAIMEACRKAHARIHGSGMFLT